jgi:gliding motility-associated-like protein
VFSYLFKIILYLVIPFSTVNYALAQVCAKDSNFYSITYRGAESNYIEDAIVTSDNEIIALGRYSALESFISKFTAQGTTIWSNEYKPDYPHTSWIQFPWYENTTLQGIIPSSNASFYVYGSAYEHGKSINNVFEPPSHWMGILLHVDKFGNVIKGRNYGNWRTDYKINKVIQLANNNLVVYLTSFFYPFISRVVCITEEGSVLWVAPMQTQSLYREVNKREPVICQRKNGNIVVARIMERNIADTIFYPFQPAIILPAPLHYFHLMEFSGATGGLLWETSYQCPTLTSTNVSASFIPSLKHITELPNNDLSVLADMYLPLDLEQRFYANRVYSRRAVNFITDPDGFQKKLIAYRPGNSSGSLESARPIGNSGERLLLIKDTTNSQLLLLKIDAAGQITWNKSYSNANSSSSSKATALAKHNGEGFFILQSDVNSFNFHATITNFAGNNSCSQLLIQAAAENVQWPWLVNKVHLSTIEPAVDFTASNFIFKQTTYPLSQTTTCEYQYVCCKDFIDSLHPKTIPLCAGQTYTLPDSTVVKDAGTYYATLKTIKGCDSILLYNVELLKPLSDLAFSVDTCLKDAPSIQLWATAGYNNYTWNNTASSPNPLYTVYSPGTYTLKVENECGIKTDTIMVFEDCDFPVYFPNAFTPNDDLVNDVLKVPYQNKNNLLRLRIFDRYGKLVFLTSRYGEGWDGRYNGEPQSAGVYTYYLEMEGLSGKKISQKGNVILIR